MESALRKAIEQQKEEMKLVEKKLGWLIQLPESPLYRRLTVYRMTDWDGSYGEKYHVYDSLTVETENIEETAKELRKVFAIRNMVKSLDQGSGQSEFIGVNTATNLHLTVKGSAPHCEIESYEVEETIPASPARTSKVTRYRLKNPLECLGQDLNGN